MVATCVNRGGADDVACQSRDAARRRSAMRRYGSSGSWYTRRNSASSLGALGFAGLG